MASLNITIGQYVKGNSFIYKLDPRLKIIATIILMVAAFLIPANSIINLYILCGFLAFLLLIMLLGRINLVAILRGLQPILFIGIFTFILQLIYNQTGEVIGNPIKMYFSWLSILACCLVVLIWALTAKYMPFKVLYMVIMLVIAYLAFIFIKPYAFDVEEFQVYKDGLIKGAFFAARLVIVVVISTMLTISTSTTDINLGLEWVLHPLSWIKLPVAELAMMFSLTLRFIPTLMIETDKIMKAQASRGIDFEEGNLLQKIKQIVTILIPMFVVSINRAEDLANAMEARGYVVGAKRTSIDVLKFRVKDLIAFILILGILAGSICVKVVL